MAKKKQTLQEQFDLALKAALNGDCSTYYASDRVSSEKYYAYYTKDEWNDFLKKEMTAIDKQAYKEGGGKELDEKYSSQWRVWMPPKMAAYASSSRFIYTLLKHTDVIFEQKLRTSIPRSVSNMDAFLPKKEFFIEAKCHEIYSSPNPKYKLAYRDFYSGLHQCCKFEYKPTSERNDSSIAFYVNGQYVNQFDVKQTISHILGIANAYKIGIKYRSKKTGKIETYTPKNSPTFIYLLYNPRDLQPFLSESVWSEIVRRYELEISFIDNNKDFFKSLFRYSLEYVGIKGDIVDRISSNFNVRVEDQDSILKIIE